jgi:hypothetical protein
MATSRESTQAPTPRPAPKSTVFGDTHPTPSGPEEGHLGATEDQVSKTMPPTADDDEPKQG